MFEKLEKFRDDFLTLFKLPSIHLTQGALKTSIFTLVDIDVEIPIEISHNKKTRLTEIKIDGKQVKKITG